MRRSIPVANEYLDIGEKNREFERHHRTIATSKACINNSPPPPTPRLLAYQKRKSFNRQYEVESKKKSLRNIAEIKKNQEESQSIQTPRSERTPRSSSSLTQKSWSGAFKSMEKSFPKNVKPPKGAVLVEKKEHSYPFISQDNSKGSEDSTFIDDGNFTISLLMQAEELANISSGNSRTGSPKRSRRPSNGGEEGNEPVLLTEPRSIVNRANK